ncbi:MAG: LPS export ABC transporter permease LptG [Pseudomonadota bacterium]|nr:MAG: LPS export ABC transporter permease LptG [Pseudomonadota bacterium]
MVILDNYIGRAVIVSVLGVLTVLVALFSVISFAGEFDEIGNHQYTVWGAMLYVLLRVPNQVYESFPLASLLGAMLGLGALASRSELVVVRTSGVSMLRIVGSIARAALVLVIVALLIGEVVAPPALEYAQQMRLRALSSQVSVNTAYGLWVRDGQNFVHVQRVDDAGRLEGVSLYALDDQQRMTSILQAGSAEHRDGAWVLNNVRRSRIDKDEVRTEAVSELARDDLMPPDVIATVSISPEVLSLWRLRDYIGYLNDNELDAAPYELAFWSKVTMPLTIGVMVLIAVPFVLGSMRNISVGRRVVIGFFAGLGFFILNRIVGQAGLVYDIHPLLSATLPTVVVMVGAILLMRRSV